MCVMEVKVMWSIASSPTDRKRFPRIQAVVAEIAALQKILHVARVAIDTQPSDVAVST